jgi:mannose-6-phosphate isomerase
MTTRLGPLRFERRFLEKVWGGRSLERRPGIALPAGKQVGETWELVDRERENSVVAEGPLQGRTLAELMGELSPPILGTAPAGKDGRFPLLVKYIDASDNLSVQVHPDDEGARRIGAGAQGKTEAWYVVDARPGALLYAGLKEGVRAEEFARVADRGEVVDLLQRWDVAAGDCLLVPGGTVHAIGAGVTILEVQQNSDTTYRLYDWGRAGRETHVELARRCVGFDLPERPPIRPMWEQAAQGLRRAPLARSRHFGVNALELSQAQRLSTGGQFQIYAVVQGAGALEVRSITTTVRLRSGDVWLVPAECGYHHVTPQDGPLILVQILHTA